MWKFEVEIIKTNRLVGVFCDVCGTEVTDGTDGEAYISEHHGWKEDGRSYDLCSRECLKTWRMK